MVNLNFCASRNWITMMRMASLTLQMKIHLQTSALAYELWCGVKRTLTSYEIQVNEMQKSVVYPVFCLGFFCRARRPAPFSWRPALLKKPKWRPALLTNFFFFFFFFKYQSHMAFSSVLPFLLPTHSVDCAVHLLLSHSRALLVSSTLFHPFTVLIMPFFFGSPR